MVVATCTLQNHFEPSESRQALSDLTAVGQIKENSNAKIKIGKSPKKVRAQAPGGQPQQTPQMAPEAQPAAKAVAKASVAKVYRLR